MYNSCVLNKGNYLYFRIHSISFQIFRRLTALFTALCVQKVVQVLYVVERSPDVRKCNNSSISSKIKSYFSPASDISTFKRSVQCIMRAERSGCVVRRRDKPRYRQNAFIRRFSRKLCDISLPFEILRRLNAPCTALCLQDVVYAFSIVEISPGIHNSQ